ncbi:MAG: hypothetical protein ACTHJ0_04550 [Flavipsychrobacter sp.]
MRKVFLQISVLLLSMLSFSTAKAQMTSPIALGLRATPDGGGFTGKFYMNDNMAIEAQLNGGGVIVGSPSFAAVGLFEYHIIMPDPSWRIFFGGGIHFGSWDRNDDNNPEGIFGIDGIGGVEYIFKNIPLGLSADLKPAINFVSTPDFFPNNFFGVAARFYLPMKGSKASHMPHHK